MPTISVAMIVKNEAADLAQCLDTVKDWVNWNIFVAILYRERYTINKLRRSFSFADEIEKRARFFGRSV